MSELFEFMDIAISEYKLKNGEPPNTDEMEFYLTPKMISELIDEMWEQPNSRGEVQNKGRLIKASYKGIPIIEVPWKQEGHPTLEYKETHNDPNNKSVSHAQR